VTPRKKIPTKAELLQLQKLYKTDEKIGERLGGTPAYLVAYWRRKKGVPKYSLPKFSEAEVRNLWERFGDDEKAGLELGISKAAFYNWRRRYGIKEKPAFLKLEQLELNFPGSKFAAYANNLYGQRTVAQKILAGSAGEKETEVGQTLELEPHLAVVGDSHTVLRGFKDDGPEFVWNPGKLVTQSGSSGPSSNMADSQAALIEFARRQGIKNHVAVGDGSCHQVIIERGLVIPGQLVLGNSGLVASAGCMGALAMELDTNSMVKLWGTGRAELTVPGTISISISGRRHRGVYAKDIVLWITRQLGLQAADGKVIEYAGSVVTQMSISERFTLTSMSVDMGAVAAICPYDATTRRYLTGRTMTSYKPAIPDRDAEYDDVYQINIDQLLPQVRCPGREPDIKPAAELENTPVNQVVIGSVSSGRFDDLRVAAEVLKGKQVAPECRVMILPGSRQVYLEALKKGLIRVFIEAGAIVLSPGSELFSSVAT